MAMVREQHFFATYAPPVAGSSDRLINIFMLDVEANSQFSNMRYLAGNYDEAAVDFFLNESKAQAYTDAGDGKNFGGIWNFSCPNVATNVDECKTKWDRLGDGDGPVVGDGSAFVIIMSTNASAISEAIGAIAENSATMKSLMFLLNKDTFEAKAALDSTKTASTAHRNVFISALDAQMSTYAADPATNANRELAILKMLAAELDPAGPAAFNTIEEARIWFGAIK